MNRPREDRRRACRVATARTAWARTARLSPGLDVVLLDVSRRGARVETVARLLPGARTLLRLTSGTREATVACVVARSVVAALEPTRGVVYRVALVFDEPLARIQWAEAPSSGTT